MANNSLGYPGSTGPSADPAPRRWRPLRLLASALVLLAHFTALGAQETVYFGGAAFTGSISEASEHIPITHAALGEAGLLPINQRLRHALSVQPPQHFRLDYTDLAALDGTGSSMAMAIAIDRETITVEQVGEHYKLLIEIATQALFFDFRERMVRFAYPVTIQRIDVMDAPPSDPYVAGLVREMLLGESPASLSPAVADALHGMKLPDAASRRLQVVEVTWSDKIANEFPQIVRQVEVGMAGHEFSKILSGGLQLGLLPYRPGHAIGNAMAARFADGRVYNLAIPPADYEIRVDLQDFRSGVVKETPAFRQDVLGAFFDIRIEEPLSGRSYMSQSLRFGATKTVPASQPAYDKVAAYYETLIAGLATFTQSIAGNEAKKWVVEQPNARELQANLKSVRELIAKCR